MEYFIAFVISAVLSYVLRPKPPKATPPLTSEITTSQIGEGRPIGVAFGRPWVKSPTCIWYGDLTVTPIKKKGGK